MLRRQLILAQELNLPVILHNREATEDILAVLQSVIRDAHFDNPLRGVFHCFNGSKETARQILNMGFYLGIGGVLTFKNCKLAETLKELQILHPEMEIPDRLLLETDAPYMAPVPHRGERNESRLMRYVVERLAMVYECSMDKIIAKTNANARLLFGLK